MPYYGSNSKTYKICLTGTDSDDQITTVAADKIIFNLREGTLEELNTLTKVEKAELSISLGLLNNTNALENEVDGDAVKLAIYNSEDTIKKIITIDSLKPATYANHLQQNIPMLMPYVAIGSITTFFNEFLRGYHTLIDEDPEYSYLTIKLMGLVASLANIDMKGANAIIEIQVKNIPSIEYENPQA
jgi:hypothetical protein